MKKPIELWLLRHCHAEPAREPGGDGARPLSARGEAQASAVGAALAARGLRAARILSSPLPRARRTGVLAAAAGLAPGIPVEEDPRLAPGGDPRALADEAVAGGSAPVMLVGHNPDLEDLAFDLCGVGVSFGKGTFVRIEFRGGEARLVERVPRP